MTKYGGKIEGKEEKKTKANMQYFCFTINGKKWNCFDAIANQEFNVGDFAEFETEKKGEFENLLPETMKRINAPVVKEISKTQKPVISAEGDNLGQECIHKNINENPDSLEIGTPSKGGAIKIYGDFSKPEEFKIKMQNAKKVRDEANRLLAGE